VPQVTELAGADLAGFKAQKAHIDGLLGGKALASVSRAAASGQGG
jgi:hypothetical protein